jgi:hypothetical protein
MLTVSLGYGRVLGFSIPSCLRSTPRSDWPFSRSRLFHVRGRCPLISARPRLRPLAVDIERQNDPYLERHLVAAGERSADRRAPAAALLLVSRRRVIGLFWHGRVVGTGWRAQADGWLRHLGAASIALARVAVLGGIALLALGSLAGQWRFTVALPQSGVETGVGSSPLLRPAEGTRSRWPAWRACSRSVRRSARRARGPLRPQTAQAGV